MAITTSQVLGGAALCSAVVLYAGWDPWLGSQLVIAAVAPALSYSDLTTRRLPNRILAPAYFASFFALAAAALLKGPAMRWATATLACVTTIAALTIVAVTIGDLGGGDIKLAGLVALSVGPLGWRACLAALLLGFVLAAAAVAVLAVAAFAQNQPRARTIPLGPYLLTASLVTVYIHAA